MLFHLTRLAPSLSVADELTAAQPMPALSGGPFAQHIEFEPRGVVAFVSAWNFPILMGVDQMVRDYEQCVRFNILLAVNMYG